MLNDIEKKVINILFLSGDEISIQKIKSIINCETDIKIDLIKIQNALKDLGLNLLNNNDNLQIVTSNEYSDILKSFTSQEYNGDLTPSALQVITIISYMGESSDADISFIRGIQSSQILRSLTTRGLLKKDQNKYSLSNESLSMLGITDMQNLPEYDVLSVKIREKLKDSLNG